MKGSEAIGLGRSFELLCNAEMLIRIILPIVLTWLNFEHRLR